MYWPVCLQEKYLSSSLFQVHSHSRSIQSKLIYNT
nr:MAG TPA: hypothetical protein [Caudoviricetes sp.]